MAARRAKSKSLRAKAAHAKADDASARTKLKTYREKRDFSKTEEPSGEREVALSPRPRFVIQKHAATRLHYDWRLELDGVFKSWAVTRGPSLDPHDKRLAVEVEDHPLDYGDFEGTIPKGEYGGGTVMLWDRGYWEPEGNRDPHQGLAKGDLKFTLHGKKLKGSWVLVRLKRREGEKRNNWLLIKHRDEHAVDSHGEQILEQDTSAASGRSMDQIAAGKGKKPKAFMLTGDTDANAVWHSNRVDGQPATSDAGIPNRAPLTPPPPAKSGKSVDHMPEFILPQLARSSEKPPTGAGWAHEIKLDGYRMQLRIEGGKAQLRTRKGLNWTEKFAAVAKAAGKLPDCIIDGEVVVNDAKGVPSFPLLQAALSEGTSGKMVFFAFDLPIVDGEDLRPLPLKDRKARLEELLAHAPQNIRFVTHIESDGAAVLQAACKMGLEGIISKRLIMPYREGRHDTWLKTKCRGGNEVVIAGWNEEDGRFRSLIVGAYNKGKFDYLGRVGTGFTVNVTADLEKRLKKVASETSPFTGRQPAKESAKRMREMRWARPEIVAEIEFGGITGDGLVRQAAFKGIREDKTAREVTVQNLEPAAGTKRGGGSEDDDSPPPTVAVRAPATSPAKSGGGKNLRQSKARDGERGDEGDFPPPRAGEVARARSARDGGGRSDAPKKYILKSQANAEVMGIAISHPEKTIWPAEKGEKPILKLELAQYYERMAEPILEYIVGRPCSIIRAPDGIEHEKFFQRHAMKGASKHFRYISIKGDKQPYLQIDTPEALIAAAQISSVELHPWNNEPEMPETPGRLVFDLDPAPDVPFDIVIGAARELRDRLKDIGLESFCKTTGGKGLHVVTPFKHVKSPELNWTQAKAFAAEVCRQMVADSPSKYLINMAKEKRHGKIFLDYLRNDRTSTAVSVLSPRLRAGAPVSMPVTWAQAKAGLDPSKYTLRSVPGSWKKHPWADYDKAARPFFPAAKKLLEKSK